MVYPVDANEKAKSKFRLGFFVCYYKIDPSFKAIGLLPFRVLGYYVTSIPYTK